jgi:outer membrane protein assembly factor BamB
MTKPHATSLIAQQAAWCGLLLAGMVINDSQVTAQPAPPGRFQLSDAVRLDEADSGVTAQLRRVESLLAARQYEEVLQTLRRATETAGSKVIRLSADRAISVRDYCQLLLASLPPEALALYRQTADPVAEKAYRQAIADRDSMALARSADQALASSFGDDALQALGELALEQGEPRLARAYWHRLFETPPAVIAADTFESIRRDPKLTLPNAALLDRFYSRRAARDATAATSAWYVVNPLTINDMTDDETAAMVQLFKQRRLLPTRLACPASDLPRAQIRAQILWADILAAVMRQGVERESQLAEAEQQLARFKKLHPAARGRLAGQDQPLAERLEALLAQARDWPMPRSLDGHTTFAGAATRNQASGFNFNVPTRLPQPAWRFSLGTPWGPSRANDGAAALPPRLAEPADSPRSFFPVVAGDLLFVATSDTIRAWDLKTGKPAWSAAPGHEPGVIYRHDERSSRISRRRSVGVPRFTLTIAGDLLAARLGNPATAWPPGDDPPSSRLTSKIVLLDIGPRGQGKLARDAIEADAEGWSFDSVPLLDDGRLWVTMRKSDVRPQVHVACYDIRANPPRRLWRTFVASAETPGSGKFVEYTHNLLTRHGETLYVNTNLGAIAAISADDGTPRWIHTYPRAKIGHLGQLRSTPHFFRDLVPCVYDQGKLFVAPADSPAVLCLDADTGLLEWTTDQAADAIHLLGVHHGHVIAGGERLYALAAHSGQIVCRWPDDSQPSPRGWGRGFIAGDSLIWPTRDELWSFDLTASWKQRKWVPRGQPVSWAPHGLAGGPVLVTGATLVLTTGNDRQAEAVGWNLTGGTNRPPKVE